MAKTTEKLPARGRSSNISSPVSASHSPRGRTTSQAFAGAASARPLPSRRLSVHGPGPTIAAPSRPAARRSQSHEAAPRLSTISSPLSSRDVRGRRSKSPNSHSIGRDRPPLRPFQSPQRPSRHDDHLRPSGTRRDSYGSPSSLTERLFRDERGHSERGRRYSFSPSSARPASGQRAYSSEHLNLPFRAAGRVSSPLSPNAASPTSPRWHSSDPHRAGTPTRHRPPYADGHGSSSRRPSFGESAGRRASDSRRHSVRSSGASSREPSRGRRGNFLGTLATFAGIEGLVKHISTAQQWTEWLSDLQDSPDEIRSLSEKATTARDTVAQIQGTLAARPDLLEGESGQRLKQHIEDAISSTNETLGVMTRLLEELSQTTAEEGTVLRGIQEYWNSYRYKSEWGSKLKEIEGQLQSQLALLSTLMINIYSRALTQPAPRQPSVDALHSAEHEQAAKPKAVATVDATATPPTEEMTSKQPTEAPNGTSDALSGKDTVQPLNVAQVEPPAPEKEQEAQLPTKVEGAGQKSEPARHITSSPRPLPSTVDATRTTPVSSPRIVELPPSQDAPDETRRQSTASAITDSEDPVETLLDAVWNGQLEGVTRALQHASPKSFDNRNMTPLHYAVERDRLAIAMLLLDRGAEVNATADRARTALHLAARSASPDMVEMLLERAGADVNVRTSDGKTPLHYAASSAADGDEDRRDVIRILRDWKADPTLEDRRGDTARDVAQKRDYWDAAATLRRAEKRWEEIHHQSWFQRHGIKK